VLTRVREKLQSTVKPVVITLARCNVKPNHLTILSLILSMTYLVSAFEKNHLLAITLIAISGFLDVLDGELARFSKLVSSKGAFLDSLVDRLNDGIYMLGLTFLGLNVYLVFLLLILSYGISYCRARGEALGLEMKGIGIIERGERVLGIMLIIAFSYYSLLYGNLLLSALIVLSLISLIERVIYAYHKLS